MNISNDSVPYFSHFQELRRRLIVSVAFFILACGIAVFFFQPVIEFFYRPFESFIKDSNVFFISEVHEGFSTKIKLSLWVGLVFSFPIHLFNFLAFIFPGLNTKERTGICMALIIGFFLAAAGFFFAYTQLLPISVKFLLSKKIIPLKVGVLLNYHKNILYVVKLLFYTLIIFQFPIILALLLKLKIIKAKTLLRSSRHLIVTIFVIAAIITPPDFISQIGLALPLILLYFTTLLFAKLLGWDKN